MILLTGARGTVGKFVVAELLRRNLSFVVLRRGGLDDYIRPSFLPDTVPLISLQELGTLRDSIHSLIHLASPRSLEFEVVMSDEIGLLQNLLLQTGVVRVSLASSQCVYGIPSMTPIIESIYVPSPVCWYDVGKLVNEYQLRMHASTNAAFQSLALRFGILFCGPKSDMSGDQFLPSILRHFSEGGTFKFAKPSDLHMCGTVYSDPRDLARAFADGLNAGTIAEVNFCSGYVSWWQLLDGLSKVSGLSANISVGQESTGFTLPLSATQFDLSQFNNLFPSFMFTELMDTLELCWSEM